MCRTANPQLYGSEVDEAVNPVKSKVEGWIERLEEREVTYSPVEGTVKHYFGREFIIVDSEGLLRWRFLGGRKYCQKTFKTDFFAINSFEREMDILELAKGKGIKTKGWIGLNDDENEGIWEWSNSEDTHDFFYWRSSSMPDLNNTDVNGAMIRLDLFGGGWDDVKLRSRTSVLICSRR